MAPLLRLLLFLALVLPVPAVAQKQQAAPAASSPPPKSGQQPASTEQTPCSRHAAAAKAAYGSYVRLLKADVPEIGEQGADLQAMSEKLETLYGQWSEQAAEQNAAAFRKTAALELLSTQTQGKPALDITRRKVCALAKVGGGVTEMADALVCAVINTDAERRKESDNRRAAKEMMTRAKGMVPAKAQAADDARMLYEDVARGLDGCY